MAVLRKLTSGNSFLIFNTIYRLILPGSGRILLLEKERFGHQPPREQVPVCFVSRKDAKGQRGKAAICFFKLSFNLIDIPLLFFCRAKKWLVFRQPFFIYEKSYLFPHLFVGIYEAVGGGIV